MFGWKDFLHTTSILLLAKTKRWWEINVTGKKNDEQLQKVLEYYPQIVEKLDKKKFKRPSKISFIMRLFSITNKPSKDDKWYKVVYILGFKFSFRNRNKETKMKLLKESEKKNNAYIKKHIFSNK